MVTKPPTLINILFTTRALTPGKLLANPHTIRPMVLPIPITETRNIAVEASMLAFIARSTKKVDKKSFLKIKETMYKTIYCNRDKL